MSEESECSSWWNLGSNLTSNLSAGLGSLSSNVTSISSNVTSNLGSISSNITSNLSDGLGSLSNNVTDNLGSFSDVKSNLSDGIGSISNNVTSNVSSGVGTISNVTTNLSSGVGSLSDVTSNLTSGVGSLWTKAKETGSYVYDFTTNDFNEVAAALKQDVIVPSATALKHKLQPHAQYGSLTDSVATMLGNVSEYLAPPTQTSVEMLSRYGQDRIHAIQTSQDTYLKHVPDDHYTDWCVSFTLEDRTHEISQLLVDNQKLRNLHTEQVPTEMSYSTFWKIFYYRTDLFNQEKERHMALLSRADQDQTEDELKWSDDEEEDGQTGGQTGDDKEETVVTEQPGTSELKKEEKADSQTVPIIGTVQQQTDTTQHVDTPHQTDSTQLSEPRSILAPVLSDDLKVDVSSEEGSYDVIKHKELVEDEGVQKDSDEDFTKELDEMIDEIGPTCQNDADNDWEDWD